MYSLLNKLISFVPLLVSIVIVLIFNFNDGSLFSYKYSPAVAAICVYYWAFFYPTIFTALSIFILGLFADIFSGYPIGLSSFCLLITYYMLISQRESVMKYGFFVFWAFFMFFLLIYYIIKLALLSLFFFDLYIEFYQLANFLFTILLYPLLHYMMSYVRMRRIVLFKI